MKTRLPNFKNKVLSVVCQGEDTGQLIGNPSFEKQGDRLFIVGTVPADASQDNWMEGLPCAIAWETVQDYVMFDSMDDYLKRLHAIQKPRPRNKVYKPHRFSKQRNDR